MTVKQLKARLDDYNEDLEVWVVTPDAEYRLSHVEPGSDCDSNPTAVLMVEEEEAP